MQFSERHQTKMRQIYTRMENVASAVREAKASPIQGPPWTPRNHSVVILDGFWEKALNWAPTMSRDVNLSDSCMSDRCSFRGSDVL